MILVTGGSGLLGKEIISQLLNAGKMVTSIYNNNTHNITPLRAHNSDNFKQIKCDILDVVGLEDVMQGVEQVYHCAALISYNPKMKKKLLKVNVEGTANVVNAALDAGVKKLVHVSSIASLGRLKKNGEVVTENMSWVQNPNDSLYSTYGKSKYLGEMEVWRAIGEGLKAVIVNPSLILGAGDWQSGSSQIFKSVYEEFPWYTEGVTGFVDVRDVAKIMIQLMESNIVNERFIVSAENRSYKYVFDLIAKAFGKKLPHKKVTPIIAKIVWRAEAIKSLFTSKTPLITKETANTALAEVYFDNTKLLQFLPGFSYRSLEETINYTCKELQQKLNIH